MDFPLIIPEDYYSGVSNNFSFPTDVLLFSRTSRKGLDSSYTHRHSRFNLIIAIEGDCTLLLDYELMNLQAGNALLIHPWQVFNFVYDEDKALKWIIWGFDCPSLATEYCRGEVKISSSFYNTICTHIINRYNNEGSGQWIVVFLAVLLGEMSFLPSQKESSLMNLSTESELVIEVQRYIFDNMSKKIVIPDIASHCAYSPSRLRALFKDNTDISLGSYIIQVRLNTAARMLAQTPLPVGEIAEKCGFASLYSFSRLFRKKMDETPSSYRRRYARRITADEKK